MTGPDFEALHYGLVQPTDWSPGTLHRAKMAAPNDDSDAEPDRWAAPDLAEEDLGTPGSFGSGSDDDVWGPTTYGGARRNRPPRTGRRRAEPDHAESAGNKALGANRNDSAVADLPDLSDLVGTPPPSWDQLLEGEPAVPAPEPDPLVALDKGEQPEPPAVAAMAAPVAAPSSLAAPSNKGLLASSRTMAIASLASRVTGFLRTAAIAAALGVVGNGVADAYNLANMLPNMVYELLIGGVLSSVLIPLLVRAQE
ncbi:MAG: conserved rane protein of unknown function, partial [Jatrophihabitantaceae bacterium]|nr:conserved rane protein of unknown function [Jatrophihabitantaceae bacterium]